MNIKHSSSFTVYPEICNFMNDGRMVHGGYMLMMMDRCAAECARRLLYDAKADYYLNENNEIKSIDKLIEQVIKDANHRADWYKKRNQDYSHIYIPTKDDFYQDRIKANSALTVNVTDVTFFVGASLGDIIFLNAEVVKLGTKRIEIQVIGERENCKGEREKICEGKFIFCAMYNASQSIPHGLTLKDKK